MVVYKSYNVCSVNMVVYKFYNVCFVSHLPIPFSYTIFNRLSPSLVSLGCHKRQKKIGTIIENGKFKIIKWLCKEARSIKLFNIKST